MSQKIIDFLGIGAQRCGTTWLDVSLRCHPDVRLPERRKEVHFFDKYYKRGERWYKKFFPQTDSKFTSVKVGEITPSYLYSPLAPSRIANMCPDIKLIVILRNPVDRAFSQYGLYLSKSKTKSTDFESFLQHNPDAFYRGCYVDQLARYFGHFQREQILVLVFEEVMADKRSALRRVCKFLCIREDVADSLVVNEKIGAPTLPRSKLIRAVATRAGVMLRGSDLDWVINVAKRIGFEKLLSGQKRIPSMRRETRDLLLRLYSDEIGRLEALVEIDLGSWLNRNKVV